MERDLLERVEALERRNRTLSLGMGALVLVLVFGVCFAAVNPGAVVDVLKVHRLEVVDPDGETRAVFDADRKNVRLRMGDPDGNTRAIFGVSDENANLTMGDANGESVILMAGTDGQIASVNVGNEKAVRIISTAVSQTGVFLFDSNDGECGSLKLNDGETSSQLVLGDDEKEHIELTAETNGKVACVSVGSKKHVELYSEASDRTGMFLYNTASDNSGYFEVASDDQPELALYNGDYRINFTFFADDLRPAIGLFKGKEAAVSLLIEKDGKGYVKVKDSTTGKANWLGP
ncbi:MAG: hypothetical protein ACYC2Y_10970 [Armatimonadota bacterium]